LGLAVFAALAFAFAAEGFAEEKAIPLPRISPLKSPQAAGASIPAPGTLPAEAAAVAATAAGEPTAFAEAEDGWIDSPDGALPEAAIDGGDGEVVEFAQDAGAGEGDLATDGGVDSPLRLAPLTEPLDPFAEPLDLTGLSADQPIDLGYPVGGPFDPIVPEDQGVLGTFSLEAKLTADGPPVASGVMWRVFSDTPNDEGKMRLVGEARGGPVTLKLKPGSYFVHAAYGRAGLTKKVTVAEAPTSDTVVLNAGGLRLLALVGDDQPLPPGEVSFDIYAPDEDGSDGRIMVLENAPPASVIGLNAGTYHVVCRYGDANAVVRADIRVEAGKLTDATVYQKAARLTLKLVEQHGGEALANTAWSVVTPAGESVVESVGAFPSVVLSAGDYTAIAQHDGNIFEQNFTVEAGLNRDVEVLLK
jgi:hypothetical protein